jgi:hypothetical protein
MTDIPPSDPKSSQRNTLGFDEFLAILVAFSTIGLILFLSFSRKDSSWNINGLLLPSPTSSAPPVTPVSPSQQVVPFIVPSVKPTVTPSPTDQDTFEDELPPVSNFAPDQSQAEDESTSSATITRQQYSVVAPGEKLPTIPPPLAFTDVPSEFWGRRFIDVLSSRGITKGFPDYSFRPNQPVTRAEFAAILQQAFGKRVDSSSTTNFKDVSAQFWAIPAINQSISTGFLKGYPDKTFQPEQKIPRVQVLVALASGLNLKVPSSPDKLLSVYKDAKEIPKYALDKVAAATESSLVVNHPDPQTFAPNQEATRAEVAAMVHQALVRIGKLQPIKSQSIVTVPR